MSSSSRRRPDRRGALLAALVVMALAPQWIGPPGAVADQLDVVAVLPAADQVSLVASVAPPPDPVLRPESFSVTAGGRQLSVRATPVMSDQLSVVVVVDASAAGAAALQDGQKGAAALLLRLPMTAQVSAVADADVPRVVAAPASGPKDALGGLTAVTAAGDRHTSDALGLALRQLPGTGGARPRVVVLYTSAPDARGEDSAHLAGRLKEAGALLAVVTPGDAGPYWSSVARDTGGVVASTDYGADTAAFDRVAATLAGRYLLAVPTPGERPATVSVRAKTASGTLSADAIVPAPAAPRSAEGGEPGPGSLALALGLGVLFLAGGTVVPLYARAASRTRRAIGGVRSAGPDRPAPRADPADPPPAPAPAPATAAPSAPATDDAAAWRPEPAGQGGREPGRSAGPTGSRPASTPPDRKPAAEPAGAGPAAPRPVPAPDSRSLTYAELDAQVARLAADVENGVLERRQAVARLALAARGRTDLLDRILETERRMTHSTLDRWPPTAAVLDLLSAARRVASGDAALVGPGGVRVEQTVLRTASGPRTLLRLSRRDGPVVHRWTVEELARDVDLATLTEDPRWEHPPS